jgi:hypothetical protein
VHEDVVVVLVVAVEDDVVARPLGLVLHRLDEPAARRHHGGALRSGEILTLVGVAVALRSEAGALAAPVEGAGDREGVVGELDVGRAAGGGGAAQAAAGHMQEVGALREHARLKTGERGGVPAWSALAEVDRGDGRAVGRAEDPEAGTDGAPAREREADARRAAVQVDVLAPDLEGGEERARAASGAAGGPGGADPVRHICSEASASCPGGRLRGSRGATPLGRGGRGQRREQRDAGKDGPGGRH